MADHEGLGPLPPLFDTPHQWRPAALDTETPHVARLYDFLLGGKDHFRADRAAAELLLRANPYLRDTCREQRDFLRRAVRHLAGEGVRQFVDVGTGLPTMPTTHQIARAVEPAARVAYVDNDPIVLSHVRVLLTDGGPGTAFVEGDLREPEALLRDPVLGELIARHAIDCDYSVSGICYLEIVNVPAAASRNAIEPTSVLWGWCPCPKGNPPRIGTFNCSR